MKVFERCSKLLFCVQFLQFHLGRIVEHLVAPIVLRNMYDRQMRMMALCQGDGTRQRMARHVGKVCGDQDGMKDCSFRCGIFSSYFCDSHTHLPRPTVYLWPCAAETKCLDGRPFVAPRDSLAAEGFVGRRTTFARS